MSSGDEARVDGEPSRHDGEIVSAADIGATAQLSHPQLSAVSSIFEVKVFELNDPVGESLAP